ARGCEDRTYRTYFDGPTCLPRLEGQGAEGEPEQGSDDGEGCYRPAGPSHAPALPSVAGRPYHRPSPSSYGTEPADERSGREFADYTPGVLDPTPPFALAAALARCSRLT